MKELRLSLVSSQKCLKKAGPKPSGPGLAFEFIPSRARRISAASNGRTREADCAESRVLDRKRELRSKEREEGVVVPRRFE